MNFSSYNIVMDTISIRRRLYVKTILLLRSHLHEFTTPSSQNVTTAIPGSLTPFSRPSRPLVSSSRRHHSNHNHRHRRPYDIGQSCLSTPPW